MSKTIPVVLPLTVENAHLYVANNGVKVVRAEPASAEASIILFYEDGRALPTIRASGGRCGDDLDHPYSITRQLKPKTKLKIKDLVPCTEYIDIDGDIVYYGGKHPYFDDSYILIIKGSIESTICTYDKKELKSLKLKMAGN